MTLEKYLQRLNEMVQNDPDLNDLTVIAASDDEGNAFNEVIYEPATGTYEGSEFESGTEEPNAICIN